MASIFISYATPDKGFARQLASHVELLGYTVWLDLHEIGIGDSPFAAIGSGLDMAEYLIVILSRHTARSSWVEKEVEIKYCEELAHDRTVILPVLTETCAIPPFLRPKRFADFRLGYAVGFAQLAITLHTMDHRSAAEVRCSGAYSNGLLPPLSLPPRTPGFVYTEHMSPALPQLKEISIELAIPAIGKISGSWRPDQAEQNAAWELYIELVTRVTVAELEPNAGVLRESLTSLYRIFTITRTILRTYGPAIARPKKGSDLSFGYLAVHILNLVLRPVLTKWHPLLLDYEHMREPSVSIFEHERRWEQAEALRQALNGARLVLVEYTRILAQVADVPPVLP